MKNTLFLISPFYAYTIFKYVKIFYSSRKVNALFECLAYLIYSIAVTTAYVYTQNPFVVITLNIVLLLLLTSMYKGDIKKQIITATAITITFLLNELFFSLLSDYFSKNYLMSSGSYYGVHGEKLAIIIARIALFVFVIAANNLKNIKNNISIPAQYWISLLAAPICTIIMLIYIFKSTTSRSILLISGICAFVINCLTFLLYDQVSLSVTRQIEQKLIEEQMSFYERHFQTMKASLDNIRLIRHDLKNRISPLYTLAKSEKYEELTEELYALSSSYNPEQEFLNCGNDIVDGIINLKYSCAKESGVTMDVDVLIPNDLMLNAFDFAVLLGNLLDNAIEAAEKSAEKTVSIAIKYVKGCLKLKVINSYDGKIIKSENGFLSRKPDQMSHGLGLKSVEKIVRKYDGNIKIEHNNNAFCVTVLMYI